ncbi:Calcium-transporting ATPase 10, plasma membrane-type [Chytriomyces hyalinus]|nr:Calcium-transporting ATPase 10, plasma membrane-type [Chytriomyces hyalinus]
MSESNLPDSLDNDTSELPTLTTQYPDETIIHAPSSTLPPLVKTPAGPPRPTPMTTSPTSPENAFASPTATNPFEETTTTQQEEDAGAVSAKMPMIPSNLDTSTMEAIRQHKLGLIKQQQSRKFDTFGLSPEELAQICSFDLRSNPTQIENLNANYGGVEGVGLLLRSNIETGLRLKMKDHTAISVANQQHHGTTGTGHHRNDTKKAAHPVAKPTGEIPTHISNANMVAIDADKRIAAFGANKIPPPPSETILQMIWGTIVEDPILKILIVGAIFVTSLGTAMCPSEGWLDGLVIVIAVVLVLGVTAGNDYSKDRKFKKLLLMQSDKKVKAIRGGKKDEISSWDVLVGDVIEVSTGDEIPADGLFISGNRLVIDESPLTGETIPVKKSPDAPFLFSGCQVSEGSGRMLVTGVGSRSSGGQIQELLNEAQSEETVLQMKLKVVAVLIGKVGVGAGILTFLGLAIRWAISWALNEEPHHLSCGNKASSGVLLQVALLAEYFVVGITVVVVAVPEGLPLAVTISLAFSMFKMIQENCFVRHLDASETMGEATCICTDKTGTLTENKMTVVKMHLTSRFYHGEGSGEHDTVRFSSDLLEDRIKNLLVESICINSDCFIKVNETNGQDMFIGSATEGALLLFAKKLGVNYEEVRRMVKKVEGGIWTFSSERKRMSTLIIPRTKTPSAPTKYRLHTKGASEIILSLCTHILVSGSSVEPLTPQVAADIQKTIKLWASEGLRTVGIAYRNTDQMIASVDAGNGINDDPEHDLVWVALIAIKDPLRKEVPGAVASCQKAGLTIRMVTGDNILTACKIARECGIMFGDGMALEGPVFRAMSLEEKLTVIPKLQVLARSSPGDKHTLVSILKDMGEVVAVTGDGTNDAPALKEADVGFAMGISGTQIARNACDIVLLDDNFVSLVSAIRWGRNVLNSIRKFLQFQLGVNLVAVTLTFIGSVAVGDSPLNTVQLLWVNLIMDSLGALALASDDPDEDILDHPPHARTASLLSPYMQEYILTQMVYQLFCTLGLFLGIETIYPPVPGTHSPSEIAGTPSMRTKTMVFTTFIFLQVSNEIMARQLNGELNVFSYFFRNYIFLIILAVIVIVQTVCVLWAGSFFGTCTLTSTEWGICLGLSAGNLVFTFICRLISKLFPKKRTRIYKARVNPTGSEEELVGATSPTTSQEKMLEANAKAKAQLPPKVRTMSMMSNAEPPRAENSGDQKTASSRWATVQAATHLIGHMSEVKKEEFVPKGPSPEFIDTWMRFRKDASYGTKAASTRNLKQL